MYARFQQLQEIIGINEAIVSTISKDATGLISNSSINPDILFDYRFLNENEIAVLQSQGNVSSNWSNVMLRSSVSFTSVAPRIFSCKFFGYCFCILGGFNETPVRSSSDSCETGYCSSVCEGFKLTAGLFNSTFYGTIIVHENCLIQDCSIVSDVVLMDHAALIRCGSVSTSKNCNYAFGTQIQVGNEVGNHRNVLACPGFEYMHYLRSCIDITKYHQEGLDTHVNLDLVRRAHKTSIIGPNSIFFNCSIVQDVCCIALPSCNLKVKVVNCNKIQNCTLACCEPSFQQSCITIDGASQVRNCILQDNVFIGSNCSVVNCVMLDSSLVDSGAVVSDSILGPDSSVCIGECTRCLLGPLVGFHHNSLLISTLWPLGRGNLACGALVGSNHTGRVSDQEAYIGEGLFVGLGSMIKFPSNLISSPYSIIAPGTLVSPCKLSTPFCLLSSSSTLNNHPPKAMVSCVPGWVLLHSPYTIDRNELKFAKRKKSNQIQSDFPIWRPWLIDCMISARNDLRNALHDNPTLSFFSSKQLTCLGDGSDESIVVSPDAARKGEDVYDQYIRRYALSHFISMCSDYIDIETEAGHVPSIPNFVQLPRHELFDGDEFSVTIELKSSKKVALEKMNEDQKAPLLNAKEDDAASDNWFDSSPFEWDKQTSSNNDFKPKSVVVEPISTATNAYTSLGDGYDSDNEEIGQSSVPVEASKACVISSTARDLEMQAWIQDVVSALYPSTVSGIVEVNDDSTSIWSQKWLTIIGSNNKSRYDRFHMLRVLRQEYGRELWCLEDMMNEGVELETAHAERVRKCRIKDWERGKNVIPDYEAVHGLESDVDDDLVVRNAGNRVDVISSMVDKIMRAFA